MKIDFKKLRKDKGLTLFKLAELSGLAYNTIRKMETMEHNSSLDSVLKYLNAVGYDLKLVKK